MTYQQVVDYQFSLTKYDFSKLTYNFIGKKFIFVYKFNYNKKNIFITIKDLFTVIFSYKRFCLESAKEILNEIEHELDTDNLNECFTIIAKDFLDFKKEPCKEYSLLNNKADLDIQEINDYIENLNKRIKKIHEDKTNGLIKNDEANKEILLIDQFIERNNKYLSDIYYFKNHKIKIYSIQRCINVLGNLYAILDIPYSYAWMPNALSSYEDIRLLPKFKDLPLTTYRKIKNEFKKDRTSIYATAENYINDANIKLKCLNMLNDNHILNNRKELLQKTISYYDTDSFVFCNIAISQIEGLITDYCFELGFSEDELLSIAVGDKSKLLYEKKLLSQPYYDYYNTVFPVTRNRLMHGSNLSNNFDDLSKLILLDLNSIMELSNSSLFDYQIKKKIIDQLKNDITSFEYIFYYCLIINYKFDSYYNFEVEETYLDSHINWSDFFTELEKSINNWKYSNYIKEVIIILKNKNILKDKCVDLLRKTQNLKHYNRDVFDYIRKNLNIF